MRTIEDLENRIEILEEEVSKLDEENERLALARDDFETENEKLEEKLYAITTQANRIKEHLLIPFRNVTLKEELNKLLEIINVNS